MRARGRVADPDLKAVGQRIRTLRQGLRQEDFAAELGISQGQLSKIERGTMPPTILVLARLAIRFRKSIDWIVLGRHE